MPLYFFSEISNIDKYAKNKFEILVLTALTVGLIWKSCGTNP